MWAAASAPRATCTPRRSWLRQWPWPPAGRIHAVQARFVVDSGAYSAKTSTGAIEANMAANVMLGPYDIRNYRSESIAVYTNKSPVGPFRGVGRPAGCFAMERILDEVAH